MVWGWLLAQDKVPVETHYLDDELRDSAYVSLVQGESEISSIAVPYSLEYIRTEKKIYNWSKWW